MAMLSSQAVMYTNHTVTQDPCSRSPPSRRHAHLHLPGHEHEELWEVDGAVAVSVDLIDHVLKLSLSGILAQRAHDCAQFFRGDGT